MAFLRVVPSQFRGPDDDPVPTYARMLYDYASADPTYLNVSAHTDITVLHQGKDWFRATDGKSVGFVPATYCEMVREREELDEIRNMSYLVVTHVCRFLILLRARQQQQ